MNTLSTRPRGARAVGIVRDFMKAYRKARQWNCDLLRASLVATRFALTGDSGHFIANGGWSYRRIHRGSHH